LKTGMATIILNSQDYPNLQPAHGLWSLYHPDLAPYRFQAETPEEAKAWQQRVRPVLADVIGFQDLQTVSLNPKLIESVDKDDYVREKWLLHTWSESVMPVYILIPKGPGPYPTVLFFHGHGYGVKEAVGIWEDGNERDTPDGYMKDCCISLCRRGFLVAAPEISCFGERRTNFSYLNTTLGQPIPDTCDHTAKLALTLGGSVLGLRVYDARRLVDYLETRTDADTLRLGAMGISGGGMHTFFSTAIDERIRACVISGYYSTFKDSILSMSHCTCNFVPGLAQFGEMYDLVGLIAPRPLLVEAGTYDPLFPIDAVRRSVEIARSKVYNAFGCPERVETDIFEGRHQISGKRAYHFLMGCLPYK
jgi:dienelactone hydrolase